MTHFGSEFEKDWSTCSLCGTRRPRAELDYPDISEAGAGKQCGDKSLRRAPAMKAGKEKAA